MRKMRWGVLAGVVICVGCDPAPSLNPTLRKVSGDGLVNLKLDEARAPWSPQTEPSTPFPSPGPSTPMLIIDAKPLPMRAMWGEKALPASHLKALFGGVRADGVYLPPKNHPPLGYDQVTVSDASGRPKGRLLLKRRRELYDKRKGGWSASISQGIFTDPEGRPATHIEGAHFQIVNLKPCQRLPPR